VTVEPGSELLHYRIVEKIGEGGMGVVWKATDTDLDREVAIKVLPEMLAADPERLARFEREARLLASLSHPNIATVFGLHEAPSTSSGQAHPSPSRGEGAFGTSSNPELWQGMRFWAIGSTTPLGTANGVQWPVR